MANDFLKIPADKRKKRIPSPLKDLKFIPTNADFGRVCDIFRGRDGLRPAMTYVNYDKDKGHIVCTDAHKLLLLSPSPFPKFDGLYRTPKEVLWELKHNAWQNVFDLTQPIDDKYPNYEAVIPTAGLTKVDVDAQKLFYYVNVLISAKEKHEGEMYKRNNYVEEEYIKYKRPLYIPYLNGITREIILRYKSNGVDNNNFEGYTYVSMNGGFLVDSLKGFFLMYNEFSNIKPTFYNQVSNRAMIFDYTSNGNDLRVSDMNGFLLMPTMNRDGFNPKSIDISNHIDFKEIPTLSLVYDLNENKILSNGELYDIDEQLGYKPKYIISKDKNSGKSEKNTNFVLEKRIKGLKILYRNTKNETIKKRIKGLEILLKKSIGDDLPF